MHPKILTEVVDYINSTSIKHSQKYEDGRINSIIDEDMIIKVLIEKYDTDIEVSKVRDWWDVKVFGYPINIKSSKFGNSANNFSSKAAILYAITNLSEDKIKVSSWKAFQKCIIQHGLNDNGRDYYIITLNKTTNKVHLSSLKTLRKITPNGNNLPFQIKWKDNTQPIYRTHKESYDFLVGCYKKSVQLKIEAHEGFNDL